MFDDYQFSDGQALSTLNSTGVVSSNIWDLEENVSTDQLVFGWINGIILSSTNSAGGTEGLWIEARSADSTNLSTTPLWHGAIKLRLDEIVTGHRFSFGVYAPVCEKYFGLWYRADTTSLSGATSVDAWFSLQPHCQLKIQKKNTSTGA
jgi:hypothetical protein